ncbi:hypothetical protein ABPG75_002144 [Micractinium tetrahymenae]
MVYCGYCQDDVDVEVDDANGFSCCVQCGRVLEDTAFSADVTFQKDAGGESTVVGQFVSETGVARGIGRIHGGRVYAYQADSHEKAQQRGRQDIAHLVDLLSVRPREESIESAHRLYKLALERGFTRGRRTNQVAAACLYLVCRQDSKPFLLIDFSDALQVNVFTLGAVFLQLAKLLRLTEHPMFSKPVDPSLYIHRFADRLDFGRSMNQVANTALRLVASMKRDWIQTGRRPSGICGAAIYIAAHIHGFERSIRDVVSVVHIGEHTLSKRLYEFSSTSASMYTAEEFEERAKQIESEEQERLDRALPAAQPAGLLESAGCEHLRMGEAHFAHAMCRACYLDFIETTGGVYNGANPPAFDRARKKEQELLALEAPEDEERLERDEAAEEFEREEQEIAEAMRTAFHQQDLQQFAAFLPSAAEQEAAMAEEQGAEARRTARGKKAAAAGSPTATAAAGRKRSGAPGRDEQQGDEEQQQEQQQERHQHEVAARASQEADATQLHADEARRGQQAQQQQRQHQEEEEEEEAQHAEEAAQRQAEAACASPTAAAAAAAGVGPSQLSDQTGAAAAAAAGPAPAAADTAAAAAPAAPAAAGAPSAAPSQLSDQTAAAAATAHAGSEEGQQGGKQAAAEHERSGQEGGEAAAAAAGAIVPAEAEGPDSLSDIDDDDVEMYLAEPEEVKCKEEIWNMMNREWLEKQAAKRAAQEAAEKIAAENAAAAEAAEAAGVQYKRGRGRPVGSKTKNQKPGLDDLPPAESAQEAAMRMLDHRKLSNKINYSALADLFADGSGGGGAGAGEPPALAAEALEGDEDDQGRGAAVTAAMRERQAAQEEEERAREARQQAALERERQKMGARAGKRVPGLAGIGTGLGVASGRLGGGSGGGMLSPRAGAGSRRAGGLGSLRDTDFRSQLTSSQQGGGGVTGGGAGGGVSNKRVRFAD